MHDARSFCEKDIFSYNKAILFIPMNTHKEKKISKSILVIVTAILLVILSISLFFFLRTLRGIRQDGWKHPPRNPMGMFLSGE